MHSSDVSAVPCRRDMRVLGKDQQSLVQQAYEIGLQRLAQAKPQPDGSLSWHEGFGARLQPVADSGIFNARVGEAFFLAALFAATGDPDVKAGALRAVAPLQRSLSSDASCRSLTSDLALGLAGVGSIIYACARMSCYVDEPTLLISSCRLANVLTRETIQSDRRYEVFWGAAGALLGLLVLADGGVADALERAVDCADHLVDSRSVDAATGLRAWVINQAVPEAGFAHGSSGIGYSLLEVYRRTRLRRFYEAALEAFTFERSVFREDVMNWADHTGQTNDQLMVGWCHGAPGVGFSRLAATAVMDPEDEPRIVADLHAALRTTCGGHAAHFDNLCCGNFGRVDFLLESGRRLGNPALVERAWALAAHRIESASKEGFRIPTYGQGEHFEPGLWQGVSGIGYELLRLADPQKNPSILVLA